MTLKEYVEDRLKFLEKMSDQNFRTSMGTGVMLELCNMIQELGLDEFEEKAKNLYLKAFRMR